VTDYTNQVRQIKADLKTVKYDMTDDMFATTCDCVSLFDKFVSFFGVCAILDLDFNAVGNPSVKQSAWTKTRRMMARQLS
jgi:hypothetical protein